MSIAERIGADTTAAMRERDRPRTEALRMLRSALHNAEIEAGRPLEESEEQTILRRQLKQREEAAEAYRNAGREERAAREAAEAEIVRGYLPRSLNEAEMRELVERAIGETGATSMREMGAVMGRATAMAGGRAEGRALSAIVRERLGGIS